MNNGQPSPTDLGAFPVCRALLVHCFTKSSQKSQEGGAMITLTCANQEIKVPSDLVTSVHPSQGSPGFNSTLMT